MLRIRDAVPDDITAIIGIVAQLPAYFIHAAQSMIREDFASHSTLVAELDGELAGFLIWRTDGNEMELIWMAILPSKRNQGIGAALVDSCLQRATTEKTAYLLTATTDSVIPNSEFDGRKYADTQLFFERLGFIAGMELKGYWGETNHALRMAKLLRG